MFTRILAFPALVRGPEKSGRDQSMLTGSEAACFRHQDKKAVVVCEVCGRFLCSLCDIMLGGRHLCSACIEAGKRRHSLALLENEKILWDNVALLMAILPFGITALAGLVLARLRWNKPSSLVRRPNTRLAAAMALSLLQLAGLAVLLWYAGRE